VPSKASLNGSFTRVSWALNKLMWYSLNEERDGKSFMGYNEFHGMKLVYTG
jgi:hypothetical protein